MADILIIEDEAPIQQLLKRMIGNMGHNIMFASDGAAGYKLVQENHFDIILSDLLMPGKPTGMDLVRMIKTTKPEVAVIIVSGHPSNEALNECRKLGITDFLSKPFEMSFVRTVVQNILQRKTPVSGNTDA